MSKKGTIIRKHTVEPQGRYFPLDSEVHRRDPDGTEHLAVVIRPIHGELGLKTQRLAEICAKALNEADA